MTPDAFAALHPRLHRLAMPGAHEGIRRHGLLTPVQIAERTGVALPTTPRREAIPVTLPDGTPVTITDNRPLSFRALAPVLDDGLTPAAWLAMLNDRVFFWPHRGLGAGNLKARARLGYGSEWQTYDTRALLAPVWNRAEIAPINTGSTVRAAARRGRASFAALDGLDYDAWRRARGRKGLDAVKEVTVRGGVPDAGAALVGVEPA